MIKLKQSKTPADSDNRQKALAKGKKPQEHERDLKLSRKDAMGGSPADASVAGEEDAGVGLEFLVNKADD